MIRKIYSNYVTKVFSNNHKKVGPANSKQDFFLMIAEQF